MALLQIDKPESWPEDLKHSLKQAPKLSIDNEVEAIARVLKRYTLKGWHCTRLTAMEVNRIRERGLYLPNRETLQHRLRELAVEGIITTETQIQLLAKNSANEENRAGKIWFCFYEPRKVDERAVGRFFRYWGGEALYRDHERNSVTGPILAQIGTPRVIEVEVPIISIDHACRCTFYIKQRWLEAEQKNPGPMTRFDSYSTSPISPNEIQRIVTYPEKCFCEITGCAEWKRYELTDTGKSQEKENAP